VERQIPNVKIRWNLRVEGAFALPFRSVEG
jgi:hypothetical protein